MPRQQVYGKRSRAALNNFAIFDSPQRPTAVKRSDEVELTGLIQEVTGLSLDDYAESVEKGRRRRALGERVVNSVLGPAVVSEQKKKPRRRKVQRVVDGEENELETTVRQDVVASDLPTCHEEDKEEIEVMDVEVEQQCQIPAGTQELSEKESARQDAGSDGSLALGTGVAVAIEDAPQLTCEGTATPTAPTPDASELDVYSAHCSQLLDLSSHPLTSFEHWAEQLSNHFTITKIAEASFGEVYRLSLIEALPGFTSSDESVFKVIALRPPPETLPTQKRKRAAAIKRANNMSRSDDVASEVKVLQRMSSIPGFTNFRDVRVLQGRPSGPFVEAFKAYNVAQKAKKKETSSFPDPKDKSSYSEDQLWAVIEMQDAGIDLERFVESGECSDIWTAWDVFWQVVLALAKGEEGAQFEHRDLHLGNICVRRKSSSSDTPAADEEGNEIEVKKKLGFTELETTIIDYTISRCLLSPVNPGNEEDAVAYHDLAQEASLFQGDSTEEYQYDIYRYMRSAVYFSEPLADFPLPPNHVDEAIWRSYHHITNLVWLHFILYKLLEQLDWPSAKKAPAKKNKEAHARWKRAGDLEHKLLKIQNLLDPETGLCKNELRSASDVVGLALSEGWLDVADVVGADGIEETRDVDESAVVQESDGLTVEELTHLQIKVDVIEEHGLEVAEQEAQQERQRSRRKR